MYAAITRTKKPISETYWSGSGWNNGAPDARKNAFIMADYSTANNSFSCNNLTIENAAKLNIQEGGYVKIVNNIYQSVNSRITVKNNGSLILFSNHPNVNSVKITSQHTIEKVQRLDYGYISSPVSGITVKSLSPATLDTRFYVLNEAHNLYSTFNPNTDLATACKGYLIRTPNNYSSTPTDWTISVNNLSGGVLNAGVIEASVYKTQYGFNLIGNPFASRFSMRKFFDANKEKIEPYLYIWDERTNSSQGNSNTIYNLVCGNVKDYINISALQAFSIKSLLPHSDLIFTPDMQLLPQNYTRPNRFYLNMFQQNINFQLSSFCYDVEIFKENFRNITALSDSTVALIKDGQNWGIYRDQNFESSIVLQLYVNVSEAANYSFKLRDISGIFETEYPVYITDNYLGITHSLSVSPYQFYTDPGEFTDRFTVHFQ